MPSTLWIVELLYKMSVSYAHHCHLSCSEISSTGNGPRYSAISEDVNQAWYADDTTGSGSCQKLRHWWDEIVRLNVLVCTLSFETLLRLPHHFTSSLSISRLFESSFLHTLIPIESFSRLRRISSVFLFSSFIFLSRIHVNLNAHSNKKRATISQTFLNRLILRTMKYWNVTKCMTYKTGRSLMPNSFVKIVFF